VSPTDTVNVNNRVQTALAKLPPEVQLQGLTVQKQSSAILQFLALYSENGKQDPLFITNYAIINVLDVLSPIPVRFPCRKIRRSRPPRASR
jgi:hydrophobic/amphiphilic exporter-1 (mainly G- bacteria), HAE1 family